MKQRRGRMALLKHYYEAKKRDDGFTKTLL